jgi:hypothetical protein
VADILLAEQSAPTTPAAGNGILFFDSSASVFAQKNDAGVNQGDASRASVAAQSVGAADTYITNSGLILPSWSMQAGMVFEWKLSASKTAASTATPIYQIRIGANQSTADTSRLSLTGPAQTAAVDVGILTVLITVRNVGAAGVLQGIACWSHNLGTATGFGANIEGTSAGFDNTALGGQFVGLSINGGTSAAWTITQVFGRVYY